jgi:hypothetical protein
MRLQPRWILLAGWLVFLLYSYPGYMYTDGADQLMDSRTGVFTDWHSPVFTQIWRIVGLVIAGPPGMLLVQSGLTVFGAFYLLRRGMSERAAAIAAACTLVFPPIMVTTAIVCAESTVAALFVASAALLASSCRARNAGGLALLVFAAGVQHGVAIAALPIIIALFRWNNSLRRWQTVAIAGGACIVVALLGAGLDRVVVDMHTERKQVTGAMADIVGTVARAEPLADDRIRGLLAGVQLAPGADIQARARRVEGKPLFFAATDQRLFEPLATAEERAAVYDARWGVIRAMPGAYFAHRWNQLTRTLGFRGSRLQPVYVQFVEILPREALATQHDSRYSRIQSLLIDAVIALEELPLFSPYVYVLVSLLLLPLALVRRVHYATMLLASGLAYTAWLFVSIDRVEYRDSHWIIVATALAIALLVADGVARARLRS